MPGRSQPARACRLLLERLEERCVLNASPVATSATLAWIPNDSLLNQQVNMRNIGQSGAKVNADINADVAWNTITTSRVVTAVVDTGIDYTHPDLYLNVWINQGEIPPSIRARLIDTDGDGRITFRDLNDKRNQGPGKITDLNHNGYIDASDILKPVSQGGWADGISNDGDKYVDDLVGWNFVNNTNNPLDDSGHGTHISGTIGATGNNGTGVAGIAWNTQIMALKTFDARGSGSVASITEAMDYAASHGARLINGSWVLGGPSDNLQQALNRMQAKGVVVVVAAGNYDTNIDKTAYYPASYSNSNLVVVTATDPQDNLASYSNYGLRSVDIAAPGTNILSTNPGKSYGMRTGTSMATPHVTGTLALVWTLRPEWTYQQVIAQVLDTADRLPSLAGKVASGRLDVAAAVKVPPRGSSQAPVRASALDPIAGGTAGVAGLAEVGAFLAPPFLQVTDSDPVPPPAAPVAPASQPVASGPLVLPTGWLTGTSNAPSDLLWQSVAQDPLEPGYVAPAGSWIGRADAGFAGATPFGPVRRSIAPVDPETPEREEEAATPSELLELPEAPAVPEPPAEQEADVAVIDALFSEPELHLNW